MNPLLIVLSIYKFVAKFPLFWRVIRNWHLISEIMNEGKDILKNAVEKGHPSCEDTQKLFALARKSLESKLIDFPDFDEAQLVSMLYDLENNLICTVNRGEKQNEKSVPV